MGGTKMYFKTESFAAGFDTWIGLAGCAFSVDKDHKASLDGGPPIWHFAPLRDWRKLKAQSVTGLLFAPILGLLASAIAFVELLLRGAWLFIFICLFPIWLFFSITNSIQLGQPVQTKKDIAAQE